MIVAKAELSAGTVAENLFLSRCLHDFNHTNTLTCVHVASLSSGIQIYKNK